MKCFKVILLTIVLCINSVFLLDNPVKASDGVECVDGSLLTYDSSSEVTVGPITRGVYLKSGTSSASNAGNGKFAAGGTTVAQKIVSEVSVTVRVERLINGSWSSYTSWSSKSYNSAIASTSKVLSVPNGYYYRVRCTHYANSDSSSSYTNGIWI